VLGGAFVLEVGTFENLMGAFVLDVGDVDGSCDVLF
jgi:hypothetical protein